MKRLLLAALLLSWSFIAIGQLDLPPGGANQKSVVTQYMGAHAFVTIKYNSPDVTSPQGQSRRGQIWGNLVPYGLTNLNFGLSSQSNPSPWRAGANENTTIELSHDMMVMGKPVPAGTYGVHLIPAQYGPWTLIFSKNATAWGSYFYERKDDVVRVSVTPERTNYHEWLTFEFTDRQEAQCTVALKWDELSIPFTMSLPDSKEIYVQHIRETMQSSSGFNWNVRNAAANYCLQNEVNLEEALAWQKVTSVNSFMGEENVATLQTLGGLQMKLGQTQEGAKTVMRAAHHPSANVFQIHGIGRQMITMGYKDEALSIFQMNLEKSGDIWPVNVGLARGYSAVGDFNKALQHARIAYNRAPDQQNKQGLAQSIEKLQRRQDIN